MAGRGFPIDQSRDSHESFRDSLEFAGEDESKHDDQAILDEHEEAERLMHGAQPATGKFKRWLGAENTQAHQGYRDNHRSGRSPRGAGGNEAVELMHDMDDAADRTSSASSEASFESDREKFTKRPKSRSSRKGRFARFTAIHAIIFAIFAAFLYGAYRASRKTKAAPYIAQALSNGSSVFQPTTLLISLDGFRADFLNRGLTPHLNALVSAGVSPDYMLPSFPSVTFPNHFTLVTGLYPESHSVVGNTFWDPHLEEEFYYTDPARSMSPRFWLAEPIWTLAENVGIRTAIHMWPGSEAHIGSVEPTYVDKFNAKEPLDRKVDRILGLLDLPGPDSPAASEVSPRPQLIAAYVPNVDADGHKYGPNSTEIRTTISEVDNMIGNIMAGLEARNLTSIVNVVVVSDHGMATTSTDRLIQLDDLVDMSQFEHVDGWPLYGLRPKPGVDILALHSQLRSHPMIKSNGAFEVYMRDVDMPQRYHFMANPRIAPLWIVPTAGWAIVTRADFDVAAAKTAGTVYHPRGLHGYDHEHPLMRAIFIARGPAFEHPPGSRTPVFQNIEVFGLVCDSIGLEVSRGNGTLSLPLGVNGFHSNIGNGKEIEDFPADGPNRGDGKEGGSGKGWDGLGELPKDGDTAPTPAKVASSSTTEQMFGIATAPSVKPDGPWPPIASLPSSSSSQNTEQQLTIATAPPTKPVNGVPIPIASIPPAPEQGDTIDDEGRPDKEDGLSAWWQWFVDKVKSVESWASERLTSHKGEGPGGDDSALDRPVVNEVSAETDMGS